MMIFSAFKGANVEVVSGQRTMRSDHMTLKRIPGQQGFEWAKASGHVFLEDKSRPTSQGAKPVTMRQFMSTAPWWR